MRHCWPATFRLAAPCWPTRCRPCARNSPQCTMASPPRFGMLIRMSKRSPRTIGAALLGPALLSAALLAAAVAAAQTAGIDPALMAKANGGDAAAQVQVAQAYEKGNQVKQSYAQAAAWYRKAADQGNVEAEIHV